MLYRQQEAELNALKSSVAQCKKYCSENLDQPIPLDRILKKTIDPNDFLLRRTILDKWDRTKEEDKLDGDSLRLDQLSL